MLKVHIVLVTKYRKKLLCEKMAEDVKQKIRELSEIHRFQVITMETDTDHIHILLEYDTTDRVCDLVKVIKQQTNQYLWSRYTRFLSKQYWKRGYFGRMGTLPAA